VLLDGKGAQALGRSELAALAAKFAGGRQRAIRTQVEA
jgi:hypothetical protein